MTADNDDLTFASSGPAGVHYARCWSCMLGSHFDPPERHDWADGEDIEAALAAGQPSPAGKRCACRCADEAVES